jgi:hypothetical protein
VAGGDDNSKSATYTATPCRAGESACLAPAILELIPANTRRTSALAVRFCMFELYSFAAVVRRADTLAHDERGMLANRVLG